MTIRIIGIVALATLFSGGCIGGGSKSLLSGDPLTLTDAETGAEPDPEGVPGAEPETETAQNAQPAPKARPAAPAVVATSQPQAGGTQDQAVAEIRARAAASAESEPQEFPNVFGSPADQSPEIKTVGEVETIQEDLQAGAAPAESSEDEAFRRRALLLWRLGQTHAQDTADAIAGEEAAPSQ